MLHGSGLVLFGLLLATPPRAGVIVVGNDAATTGSLQRALEMRLESVPQLSVRGGAAAAAAIGAKTPPAAMDPVASRRGAELLDAASRAYYEDRLVDALDGLAAVAAHYDRTPFVPTADRVKLLLWRTAVLLALQDQNKAEAEARAALVLQPQLQVDTRIFRPSLGKLVDEIRARGLPTAKVLLDGLPAGAEARIDDRLVVDGRATIPVGKHRLLVRGPGFTDLERVFEIASDSVLPACPPVALDPMLGARLLAMVPRGESDLRVFEKLAERLDVDTLVLAAARTEPASESRAVVWTRTGGPPAASPVFPAWADGQTQLAEWVAQRLIAAAGTGTSASSTVVPVTTPPLATTTPRPVATATPVAVAVATPRPGRTPAPPAVGRPPRRTARSAAALTAEGGIAIASRARDVKGGGAGYASSFVGAGPRVAAGFGYGALAGELEISHVSYAFSRLNVNLPSAERTTVDGGSTTFARLAGGRRIALGGDPEGGISVLPSLGLFFESHQGNDLKEDGAKLGVFPSQQRLGVDLRVDGRVPAGPVAILAGVGITPFSTWSESPSGATGTSPVPGVVPAWRLGADHRPNDRLAVGVLYSGELRTAKFKGEATPPLSPPVTNAQVTELLHTLTATTHYRF